MSGSTRRAVSLSSGLSELPFRTFTAVLISLKSLPPALGSSDGISSPVSSLAECVAKTSSSFSTGICAEDFSSGSSGKPASEGLPYSLMISGITSLAASFAASRNTSLNSLMSKVLLPTILSFSASASVSAALAGSGDGVSFTGFAESGFVSTLRISHRLLASRAIISAVSIRTGLYDYVHGHCASPHCCGQYAQV